MEPALAAAHPELGFPALITIATPVDFNEVRFLATLFRDGRLKPDDVLDADGLVPPDVCRNAFRIMKPTAEISAYANLWQQLWNDRYVGSYQAFAQWARDHVPFPGAMLRQVVHLLVEDNSLLRGTMRLGGRPVDLAGISCPVLCVIAEKDHVVPPAAAEPLVELLGPERVDILRIPGGHVSLLVGPVAAKVTLPEICDWAERHRRPT